MDCYALYRGSPTPIYKCQRLHDLLVTTIYRLLLLHDMWWMLKHDIWWMLLLHDMWWMHKHDMWWMTVTFLSLKGTAWPFGQDQTLYTVTARHVMDAQARHVMDDCNIFVSERDCMTIWSCSDTAYCYYTTCDGCTSSLLTLSLL